MQGSSREAPNDIENQNISFEDSMGQELYQVSPVSRVSLSRCIYRVPRRLRHAREEAYTPKSISIGPLHHGKKDLLPMEEHKKRYLQDFLGRSRLSLNDYILKIKAQEERLRNCYMETIKFDGNDLARIVLVDAIFIIEVLLRYNDVNLMDANDCIFGKPRLIDDILPDLLLLENQLPFFILEVLSLELEITKRYPLVFLSHIFLESTSVMAIQGTREENVEKLCSHPEDVKHLLDLLRTLLILPLMSKSSEVEGAYQTVRSITELQQAGVTLKVASSQDIFSIQFTDGVLEIPKLTISDHSEVTFRNIIAYEQCEISSEELYIGNYFAIMDSFVNTSKDVDLLVDFGIVDNNLGDSKEVSRLINGIGAGVSFDPDHFIFSTVCQNLNEYCNSKWHRRMANLRQNYFNTPWTTISVIAAGILLVLTLIQTVSSVISIA